MWAAGQQCCGMVPHGNYKKKVRLVIERGKGGSREGRRERESGKGRGRKEEREKKMGKRRTEGKGKEGRGENGEKERERELVFIMLLPEFFERFLKYNFALWQ